MTNYKIKMLVLIKTINLNKIIKKNVVMNFIKYFIIREKSVLQFFKRFVQI